MQYAQTEKIISDTVELLKTRGCLDTLTENEKLELIVKLKNIATTAIMDADSKIRATLMESYNYLKDIRPVFFLGDPLK